MDFTTNNVMSTDMVTAFTGDSMDAAYEKLKNHNIRHLPVLDRDKGVVGIISDRDFQRALKTESFEDPKFPYLSKVRDYMSTPAKVVSHQEHLSTVVKMMMDNKISAVLVSNGVDVTGIITHEDLLAILLQFLKPQKNQMLVKVENWFLETPVGDVARTLSDAGI